MRKEATKEPTGLNLAGFMLVGVGAALAVLSALADPLGLSVFNGSEGWGQMQTLGMLIGIQMGLLGLFLWTYRAGRSNNIPDVH